MPFYKRTGDTIITAETVAAPRYTLTTETATTQTFPVDGWVEAASLDAALPLLAASVVNGVPQSVTMRQARLALLGAGLLAAVETAINSLPEPTKSAAKIEWEYSQEVFRNRGLVVQMAGVLGLTAPQLDALFAAAAAIP